MKVFVVVEDYDYEGSWPKAVYSSEEKANEVAKHWIGGDGASVHPFTIDEDFTDEDSEL